MIDTLTFIDNVLLRRLGMNGLQIIRNNRQVKASKPVEDAWNGKEQNKTKRD